MTSDTDAETRRIPGRGATRIAGEIRRGVVGTVVGVVVVLLVALLALLGLRPADALAVRQRRTRPQRAGGADRHARPVRVPRGRRAVPGRHRHPAGRQVPAGRRSRASGRSSSRSARSTRTWTSASSATTRSRSPPTASPSRSRCPGRSCRTPNVDPNQSRVLNQDLGVIDRLGNLFSDQPNPQNQQMYQLAQQRLADAAKQVGLQKRAEDNTRATLDKLMRSLGFTTVNITFVNPGRRRLNRSAPGYVHRPWLARCSRCASGTWRARRPSTRCGARCAGSPARPAPSTDYGPEGIRARADLARATLAELDAVLPGDRAPGSAPDSAADGTARDEAAARFLRGRLQAELPRSRSASRCARCGRRSACSPPSGTAST